MKAEPIPLDSDALGSHWQSNERELSGIVAMRERFINLGTVRDGFAWRYVTYDRPGEFTAAEVFFVGAFLTATETLNEAADWQHLAASPFLMLAGPVLFWIQKRSEN